HCLLFPFLCRCSYLFFSSLLRLPPTSSLFPYTTLFRSHVDLLEGFILELLDDVLFDDLLFVDLFFIVVRLAPSGDNRQEETNRRSEEHTSELQSRVDLVCRLLLEKKNRKEKRDDSSKTG